MPSGYLSNFGSDEIDSFWAFLLLDHHIKHTKFSFKLFNQNLIILKALKNHIGQ